MIALKESALNTEYNTGTDDSERPFVIEKTSKTKSSNIFNKGLTHIAKATGNGINFLVDIKDNILSRLVSATGFVTFKTRFD